MPPTLPESASRQPVHPPVWRCPDRHGAHGHDRVGRMTDVTDATFEQAVVARSARCPSWSTSGRRGAARARPSDRSSSGWSTQTEGAVELAKVNVDENPQVAASFQVQSIPAVFALRDGKVVDGFVGALPEAQVAEFVGRAGPPADRGRPARWPRATRPRCARRSSWSRTTRVPSPALAAAADRPGRHRRGRSSCWPGCPRRRRSGRWRPRPGWPARQVAVGDDVTTAARRAARPGPGRRRRPARSSSTCSRRSAPRTRGPPATARRSPPGCSDRGRPSRRPVLELGRSLRPDPPGAGHGHPQPDARLVLRPGPPTASTPPPRGPSSSWPRGPTCSTSVASRPAPGRR